MYDPRKVQGAQGRRSAECGEAPGRTFSFGGFAPVPIIWLSPSRGAHSHSRLATLPPPLLVHRRCVPVELLLAARLGSLACPVGHHKLVGERSRPRRVPPAIPWKYRGRKRDRRLDAQAAEASQHRHSPPVKRSAPGQRNVELAARDEQASGGSVGADRPYQCLVGLRRRLRVASAACAGRQREVENDAVKPALDCERGAGAKRRRVDAKKDPSAAGANHLDIVGRLALCKHRRLRLECRRHQLLTLAAPQRRQRRAKAEVAFAEEQHAPRAILGVGIVRPPRGLGRCRPRVG
mmetsp:Transcript_4311/g.14615  ORF Transcript_4311/g.14615 Transcript_4311/m.14615 type:complete len:293 (+) Transcript_4311:66-944(+)